GRGWVAGRVPRRGSMVDQFAAGAAPSRTRAEAPRKYERGAEAPRWVTARTAKLASGPARRRLSPPARGSGGLADHRHLDVGQHIGVQRHFDLVLADGLERTVRHPHHGLLDGEAFLLQRLGNVEVADRTEQATVDTGLFGELDGHALDLLAQRLGGSQLVGLDLLE